MTFDGCGLKMNKNIIILSFIVASRFFGLFIVLPVISLYAKKLSGANDVLIGLIVGFYAIFQMIFSIPFGAISDKIGRKKTMLFGLLIFIIGCFFCANASDIYTMLFGRILQGSGSIGGVASAMIADFVKEEERGKAMSVMGGMIGMSFALAVVAGPILASFFGLSSLFYFSAFLSFMCICFIFILPQEKIIKNYKKHSKKDVFYVKDLNIMYFTNMFQKMIISSSFMIIPIKYIDTFLQSDKNIWMIYSFCMFFGFLAMGIGGVFGEKKGFSKLILIVGVILFFTENVLFLIDNFYVFLFGVFVFFVAFCLHEPVMQSTVSKFCKVEQKGFALGVFNSFGYFGSFFGAFCTGWFLHNWSMFWFYIILCVLCLIWLFFLVSLTNPNSFKNLYLDFKVDISNICNKNGIIECYESDEKTIIKYNSKFILENEILQCIKG